MTLSEIKALLVGITQGVEKYLGVNTAIREADLKFIASAPQTISDLIEMVEAYREVAIDRCFLGIAEPYRLGVKHLRKLRDETFSKEIDERVERILKEKELEKRK